ncbi:hypothetical protein D9M68_939000 [compost metagenome]
MRRGRDHGIEHQINLSSQQVRHRLSRAAVGHVHHERFRLRLEMLHHQMVQGSVAAGRITQLAGLRPGVAHQFGVTAHGQATGHQ